MKVPPRSKHSVFPVIAAGLVFVGLLSLIPFVKSYVKPFPQAGEEWIRLPSGKVLYVVVAEEGAYIGDTLIKFSDFDASIGPYGKELRPDYFIVLGTGKARYGNFAEVYAAVKGTLKIPGTIFTQPYETGTRRPAVASYRYFWQY